MPPIPSAIDLKATFSEPIVPSLKIGAATGICGFLVGGGIGILRSAHPGLVATFTGTQFFVLGGSFLYTREAILKGVFSDRGKKADLISSTTAGAVSGAVAGAFYGRVNSVFSAALVGSIGYVGQRYVHAQSTSRRVEKDERPLMERLVDSKWIPLKSISNNEYERLLKEKLLKVEAELALVDEKLHVLRTTDLMSSNPTSPDEVAASMQSTHAIEIIGQTSLYSEAKVDSFELTASKQSLLRIFCFASNRLGRMRHHILDLGPLVVIQKHFDSCENVERDRVNILGCTTVSNMKQPQQYEPVLLQSIQKFKGER